MSDSTGVSTKKLKSMLKMLREHGVSRFKDGEIEIEFGDSMPIHSTISPKSFNMDDYEPQTKVATDPETDDLGNSEEDYLFWSANEGQRQ